MHRRCVTAMLGVALLGGCAPYDSFKSETFYINGVRLKAKGWTHKGRFCAKVSLDPASLALSLHGMDVVNPGDGKVVAPVKWDEHTFTVYPPGPVIGYYPTYPYAYDYGAPYRHHGWTYRRHYGLGRRHFPYPPSYWYRGPVRYVPIVASSPVDVVGSAKACWDLAGLPGEFTDCVLGVNLVSATPQGTHGVRLELTMAYAPRDRHPPRPPETGPRRVRPTPSSGVWQPEGGPETPASRPERQGLEQTSPPTAQTQPVARVESAELARRDREKYREIDFRLRGVPTTRPLTSSGE